MKSMPTRKTIAVIPARGGSKRLPNKNSKLLLGKPLVCWTIESALGSHEISEVVISSDSDEILSIANSYSPIHAQKRSSANSNDHASSFDYLSEVLANFNDQDHVILLQPTSPLRTINQINEAIDLSFENSSPVVSVSVSSQSPYWSFRVGLDGKLEGLFPDQLTKRSQDLPTTYCLNGAIYIDKISDYMARKSFITPETTPYIMSHKTSIDIDTEEDFRIAENEMLSRLNGDK
jgi:CMP-N-acetylneuraminic acid synthetase